MHGKERKKTSSVYVPGQPAGVSKGSSFQLLELRITVNGTFGNGVAQSPKESAMGTGSMKGKAWGTPILKGTNNSRIGGEVGTQKSGKF